jgi:hypothetical protein
MVDIPKRKAHKYLGQGYRHTHPHAHHHVCQYQQKKDRLLKWSKLNVTGTLQSTSELNGYVGLQHRKIGLIE